MSHGLWAYAIIRKKAKFWPTVFFAVMPDVVWWPITIIGFFGYEFPTKNVVVESPWPLMPDNVDLPYYPDYVYTLYDIPHSLILCGLVFLLIYSIEKRVYLPMLGWPIHILLDIPSHGKIFFPTKMLYPLSDFSIDGIPWVLPYFFIPNCLFLIAIYSVIIYKYYKKRSSVSKTPPLTKGGGGV